MAAGLAAIGEYGAGVSTEQIAQCAGIPRPRLYRHFTDAEDLYGAIGVRVAGVLIAEMSPALTRPIGTPRGIITRIVGTFVTWLTDNVSLYNYLVSRPIHVGPDENPLIVDVRDTISGKLHDLLSSYLDALGIETGIADPLAHGLVGMVESTTRRWLVVPGAVSQDELITQLSTWLWGLLDSGLRTFGLVLDPDQPLPVLPP